MRYLFTALELAFYTLIFQSDLPVVVADPLSMRSKKGVERLQAKFYEEQQKAKLLRVEGDTITLDTSLALCLTPVFEGEVGVLHLDTEWARQTNYNICYYISEKHGVTALRNVTSKYRVQRYELQHYPDITVCQNDFLKDFNFEEFVEFTGKPLKICVSIGEMEKVLESYDYKEKIFQVVLDFAQAHQVEADEISDLFHLFSKDKAVSIEVGRRETIKLGGIIATVLLEKQYMTRFIASPDGDLATIESFSKNTLLQQLINFEGR